MTKKTDKPNPMTEKERKKLRREFLDALFSAWIDGGCPVKSPDHKP